MNCAIEGCDRPAKCRGWCTTHYSRWRRTGDVGTAEIAIKGVRRTCKVEGCDRDATALKMCGMHHLRYYRHGTVEVQPKAGPGSRFWKTRDELTYDAAHDRVKRQRGAPSAHECIDCGQPAADWAYQHHAADPLYDERGWPYSDDVTDYAPMCRPCHKAFDVAQSRRNNGGDGLTIVTLEEAADFAGVSVTTVRSWAKRGLITPVKERTNPLLFRYEDVAAAQYASRSQAWRARHAAAVQRWLACA